jgi:Ca2+-binding EF-hand superfamily protein
LIIQKYTDEADIFEQKSVFIMLDENQTGILSAEELKVGFALIKERLTE